MLVAITKLRLHLLLSAVTAFLMFTFGCRNGTVEETVSDKPIADFQKKLLDIAFETATAIPVTPHIKDRSKAQQIVVQTCLQLDQPKQALAYIERIENWRRGLCYADLALYCAKRGFPKQAQHCLELAGQIAGEDHGQEWRNNRIKIKMAETQAELGQSKQAEMLKKDLADSETDTLTQTQAKVSTEGSFDEQIKILDGLIKTGDYAIIEYALKAYARLFNLFYDNENCRSLAEERIRTSWDKLPLFIRMELLIELANFALDNKDKSKAIELVNEAQLFINGSQWRPEQRIVYMARLSELLSLSGDIEKARDDADAALALFNAPKGNIVNIYRAETIRPLAQAYQSMGQTQKALSVYKQAVEEGVVNPNSRPCAEDLSAACCSMALNAVEPDAELWARIKQILEGLGQPW